MTNEQLYQSIQNSFAKECPSEVFDNLKQYVSSHCYSQHRISITDSFTNETRLINVGCNHCFHCKDTYTNSWVGRLYAHAESFPYVYFVTLSYAPIYNDSTNVNKFLLDYIKETCPIYDNYNTHKKLGFNPCLLSKTHYQNYIKRLRLLCPDSTLSYFMSGEYGTEYGRPHYHFIIFSDCPVSLDNFTKAWSIKYHIKPDGSVVRATSHSNNVYTYTLGDVTAYDLVSNGNFSDTPVIIHGQARSARFCFKYVCKYVFKRSFNDTRLRLLYDSITCKDVNLLNKHFIKSHSYDSFSKIPLDIQFKNVLSFSEFCDSHKPFTEMSRTHAIGKIFIQKHIASFANRVPVKPALYVGNFITPKYFLDMVKNSLFSLQHKNKTSENSSYVIGSLKNLHEALSCNDVCSIFTDYYHFPLQSSDSIKFSVSQIDDNIIDSLSGCLPSKKFFKIHALKDRYNHISYILVNHSDKFFVSAFTYNRSKRSYEYVTSYTLPYFCSFQLRKLDQAYEFYKKIHAIADSNTDFYSKSICLIDEIPSRFPWYLDFFPTLKSDNNKNNKIPLPFGLSKTFSNFLLNQIVNSVKQDYNDYISTHFKSPTF